MAAVRSEVRIDLRQGRHQTQWAPARCNPLERASHPFTYRQGPRHARIEIVNEAALVNADHVIVPVDKLPGRGRALPRERYPAGFPEEEDNGYTVWIGAAGHQQARAPDRVLFAVVRLVVVRHRHSISVRSQAMTDPHLPASRVIPGMADSHVHTTALSARGIDVPSYLHSLEAEGAGPILDVAIRPDLLDDMRAASGDYAPGVWWSSGLHPSETGSDGWRDLMDLTESHAAAGTISAIGETGLDWYRLYAPRDRQLAAFDAHVQIARRYSLPVIVHNREADEDCLSMLTAAPTRGIMHCYSSGPERVSAFLDAGMFISFAGNLTFRSAGALRDALLLVPPERLLFETDCPWLAPHPHRGATNHPGLVGYTITLAAEVRGVSPEELALQTAANLTELLAGS